MATAGGQSFTREVFLQSRRFFLVVGLYAPQIFFFGFGKVGEYKFAVGAHLDHEFIFRRD